MSTARKVYLGDIHRRPGIFALWEKQRNRPGVHHMMECFSEAFGVFLYVFPGVGATLAFILGGVLKEEGIGSVLTIGFAYAMGILFALGVAGNGASDGHFNPTVTINMAIFRGFPLWKVPGYIFSQIFGGYIACMIVYYQWRNLIHEMIAGMTAAGASAALFTPNGPPGAFGLYTLPGLSLGTVFFNEFVCSFFVGIVIWASMDPTNAIIKPSMAAPYIALSYAAAIWSFSTVGLSLNTARDLGGRLWAITIWGTQANGGKYAAIAALTNIPATTFAVLIYEIFLVDSDKRVTPQALEHGEIHHGNRRLHEVHDTPANENILEKGQSSSTGKASVEAFETVN